MKNWYYNEFKHCGVDYSTIEQAEKYDTEHQKFRNYEEEYREMLNYLSLSNTNNMTLIDFGCGTGALSICASNDFKKIYAVDVSEVMLKQAQSKAEKIGIKNIEFINAGFLGYKHNSGPVDLITSKIAFHHLPDFWKQISLFNINKCLKMEGIFDLFDIIYSLNLPEIEQKIDEFISGCAQKAGKEMKEEVETHIREEYSTFDWIIEGMLKRAGFEIVKSRTFDGFSTEFVCKKNAEIK